MRKILQNIYKKPKAVRENYALATAGIFTFIVCVFWVTARLQTPIPGGSIVSDSTSPFATLIKETKAQFAALKAAVPEAPVAEEETATTSATTSAATLILTEDDKATAAAKASSTATSGPKVQYKEVLIGTTTATSTQP